MTAGRSLRSQLFTPASIRPALVGVVIALVVLVGSASPGSAQQVDIPDEPGPAGPPAIELPDDIDEVRGADDDQGVVNFSVDLGGEDDERPPSESVVLIIGLTLLSVAPSLVIMLTSFTRIVIVFSLVRSALGVQSIPPNQVVIGLSLFLSLFIMGPTLQQMNDVGLQPYLDGEKSQSEAYDAAVEPLREFMFANTGNEELELMLAAQDIDEPPETPDDVSMSALIPAFILSELKAAFIIGFVVFMPFLVIDLVVSAVLMSLGMMMLPPVFVSLPFKILLFVMVNGWVLVAETLITSFNTV
ncbi:MAG: flagellar type III secretion system pore protein FliP [Actinomycetota bacterium]